jgi:hypothetical protein
MAHLMPPEFSPLMRLKLVKVSLALAEKEILPHHHLVGMGYTSARLIVSSQQEYNVDLLAQLL